LMVDAMSKPPPALGSGKFGTTCERMHEANLRPCPTGTDAAFVVRARRAAASDGHQAAHGEEDRHEAPVAMQRHERHTQPVTVGRYHGRNAVTPPLWRPQPLRSCSVAAGELCRSLPLRPAGDPRQQCARARSDDARWLSLRERSHHPQRHKRFRFSSVDRSHEHGSGSARMPPRRSDLQLVLALAFASRAQRSPVLLTLSAPWRTLLVIHRHPSVRPR